MEIDNEEHVKFSEPIGAIWIHGNMLKRNVREFIESKGVKLNDDDLETIFTKRHTFKVKVNYLKENFIAIENGKKRKRTQPDYFLHVYQTDTGSSPIFPWRPKASQDSE